MKVTCLALGPLLTNTYILEKDDQVIIIDPTGRYEKVAPYLENKQLLACLLTHGHFDHIGLVDDLYARYKMPIYLNINDHILVKDIRYNTYGPYSGKIDSEVLDIDEGIINIGPFEIYTMLTPGHTEGSVIYMIEDCMFTGDTLFKGGIGRCDLYGGSNKKMLNSLNKIKTISKDYKVYPGHEKESTLFLEFKNNPYLK